MLTVNLIDQNFSHVRQQHGFDGASWFLPKKIQYIRDQTKWDGVTLFTDSCVYHCHQVACPIKIAWMLEPPVIYNNWYINYEQIEPYFDYILTFDRKLLERNPQKYIRFHASSIRISPEKCLVYPKSKLLSLCLSDKKYAPGHKLRHDIAERFGSQMDIYGDKYIPYPDCLVPYKDHAFVITVMNCKMDYYFTEYLTHAFATGAVPVFWGCPSIGDIFNSKGMIVFDTLEDLENILPTLSFEMYETMKPHVLDNFERAKNYITMDDSVADALSRVGLCPQS